MSLCLLLFTGPVRPQKAIINRIYRLSYLIFLENHFTCARQWKSDGTTDKVFSLCFCIRRLLHRLREEMRLSILNYLGLTDSTLDSIVLRNSGFCTIVEVAVPFFPLAAARYLGFILFVVLADEIGL